MQRLGELSIIGGRLYANGWFRIPKNVVLACTALERGLECILHVRAHIGENRRTVFLSGLKYCWYDRGAW